MNWIKQLIDYKNISILSFEKSIGTRRTIDIVIMNNSNLRSDLLTKIIETYPEINTHWLLTGKGEMLKNMALAKCSSEEKKVNVNKAEEYFPTFSNKESQLKKEIIACQKAHLKSQIKVIESKEETIALLKEKINSLKKEKDQLLESNLEREQKKQGQSEKDLD